MYIIIIIIIIIYSFEDEDETVLYLAISLLNRIFLLVRLFFNNFQ